MAGGITAPALGGPMCVERMTGGGAIGPAALVAGGPPGISGLDIQVHERDFDFTTYTMPILGNFRIFICIEARRMSPTSPPPPPPKS